MPATHSFVFDKQTATHLAALAESRASAAEAVREAINELYSREHPPLALGFWRIDVPGEVETCAMCEQRIAEGDATFAALMSDGNIIAPLCVSCANTD